MSALDALLDALNRGRAIYWTGNVVVEFDKDYIPSGPVTMVLDAGDFAELGRLATRLAIRQQLDMPTWQRNMSPNTREALDQLRTHDDHDPHPRKD